jgi:hypothetical protein
LAALAAASAAIAAFEADSGARDQPAIEATAAPAPAGRLTLVFLMLVPMLAGAGTAWVYRAPLARAVAAWLH